jgi:hypothetical protein
MTDTVIWSPYGVRTEITHDDDGMTVKRTQRVDKIIDSLRHDSENVNRKAAGRIGARIPIETYYAWRDEWKKKHADRWEWPTFLAQRINNPDYSKLRNQKL